MSPRKIHWSLGSVFLLLVSSPLFSTTLSGTVSGLGPAGQLVYETGLPHGYTRVYYSDSMVTPSTAGLSKDAFIAVDGSFDTNSNFIGTAVRVIVDGMPNALDDYVSTTGSDSNDGSSAHPWRTISHASDALTLGTYGTVVHVAPGDYSGEHSGAGVQINRSGTSTARIRFISDGQWQAKASGNLYGIYTSGSYVDVANFDVSAPTAGDGIDIGPNPAVAGQGVAIYVLGNYVHDVSDGDSVCRSGAGIASSSGDGPGLPPAQGIVSGNVVDKVGNLSLTTCNQTHGIYVSNDWTVENNVVSNAVAYGLHFYKYGCNMTATNNTVFHNGQGGILLNATTGCDGDNTISNNIVVNNGFNAANPAIREYNGGSSTDVLENNLLAGNANNTIYIAGGTPTESGNIFGGSVSSIFVSYADDGSGDYHLAAGSPAIDAGASAPCVAGSSDCVPIIDFDGFTRPQGTAYCIGAYEYR